MDKSSIKPGTPVSESFGVAAMKPGVNPPISGDIQAMKPIRVL